MYRSCPSRLPRGSIPARTAVFTNANMLLHCDNQRDKPDYTEAHLHICARQKLGKRLAFAQWRYTSAVQTSSFCETRYLGANNARPATGRPVCLWMLPCVPVLPITRARPRAASQRRAYTGHKPRWRAAGRLMGPRWGQRAGPTDPTRLSAGRVSSLTSANNFHPRATPSHTRKVTGSIPVGITSENARRMSCLVDHPRAIVLRLLH
jgi:hypothetical protein